MTALYARRAANFSRTAGFITLLTGAAVLLGWTFEIETLKSLFPGWTRMASTTAFGLIAGGAAIVAAGTGIEVERGGSQRWLRWIVPLAATVLSLIGILRLGEYAGLWNLAVDDLFLPSARGTGDPAQIAPVTALAFLSMGISLFLLRSQNVALFQTLVLFGGLAGWFGLSRYIFGGAPLYYIAQMAVHTALSFLLLSIGLFCLRTDGGVMALLISETTGGWLARRLVPSALVVPILAGWLRLVGQRAGWYGTEAGVAILALSYILIFGGLILTSARLLDRSETGRTETERKLLAQFERLELLQQITRAIGERQDVHSIFQAVVSRLEDHLGIDFVCICRHSPGAGYIAVDAVGNRNSVLPVELSMTERAHIEIDENGLSRCIGGKLVYEPDLTTLAFPFPRRLAAAGLKAFVAAPLLVENQVFGMLIVARRKSASFTSGECEFLKQLSEHVALAAHQGELHTALRQAYEDLRQTQDAVMQQERLRALGQMASGIAHDINNAISPVALYMDLLLEKEPNLSTRTRQYLEITQRAISDVAHTVARMREFYRKREGVLELAPVDMNHLVQQVVDLTRARWHDMPQQRGIVIRVRTVLVPDAPAVNGIESEIREALTNLIFNAVDAMPEGGQMVLRTFTGQSPLGAELLNVEVSDSGVGMDEEARRRCLEPFFTTKGERGTGLGLAMVYGVVRRHRADIEITSAPGKGTTIRLSFSAAQEIALEATSALLAPAPMRLLVVDDDPLLIKAMLDILESDGHQVVTATSGREALDAFRSAESKREPFAAVLTDLGMPYMDGRRVASAVKAASPGTPVILLTGWGQRLAVEGDVPPDVDRVLSKPPNPRELREALAVCTQSRAA